MEGSVTFQLMKTVSKKSIYFIKNPLAGVAVDGSWGAFGSWSLCPVTCGGAIQSRIRSCNNPPPANGGKLCVGAPTETQSCGMNACPVKRGNSI